MIPPDTGPLGDFSKNAIHSPTSVGDKSPIAADYAVGRHYLQRSVYLLSSLTVRNAKETEKEPEPE